MITVLEFFRLYTAHTVAALDLKCAKEQAALSNALDESGLDEMRAVQEAAARVAELEQAAIAMARQVIGDSGDLGHALSGLAGVEVMVLNPDHPQNQGKFPIQEFYSLRPDPPTSPPQLRSLFKAVLEAKGKCRAAAKVADALDGQDSPESTEAFKAEMAARDAMGDAAKRLLLAAGILQQPTAPGDGHVFVSPDGDSCLLVWGCSDRVTAVSQFPVRFV